MSLYSYNSLHVIYPHIHVNMYVMYSCKYVVNKLKLKLKLMGHMWGLVELTVQ